MANPSGTNGGLHVPGPAYGDVKRQATLLREAPISGAPVSAAAVNAPRRAKRAAAKGGAPTVPAPALPVPAAPGSPMAAPAQDYGATLSAITGQLAALPGAGPNVMWLAQQAGRPQEGPVG